MMAGWSRWEIVGRGAGLLLALLAFSAVSAITELYWPEVYEFLIDGLVTLGLIWLIFWRRR